LSARFLTNVLRFDSKTASALFEPPSQRSPPTAAILRAAESMLNYNSVCIAAKHHPTLTARASKTQRFISAIGVAFDVRAPIMTRIAVQERRRINS
jgi:hypothetical protein